MSPAAAMTGSSVADATDVSDASEANEATTAIVSEKPTNGKRYFKVNSSAVKNASNAANARQISSQAALEQITTTLTRLRRNGHLQQTPHNA